MFGRRSESDGCKPQRADRHLTSLLHEWKSVEPQTDFDAAVWRRIGASSMPAQRRLPVMVIMCEWFISRPAWVNAVAAAAGVIVGVGLALFMPAAHHGRQAGEPLLHSRTLAGSYLAMAAGETP